MCLRTPDVFKDTHVYMTITLQLSFVIYKPTCSDDDDDSGLD